MRDYIEQRVLEIGNYIAMEKTTVRQAAKRFGISKSTVHKDVSDRLFEINRSLYQKVRTVLDSNKATRHIRGGEATREKYKKTTQ